ncbi:retrovirus-related pol polyprotein from transposon TNT 1-94 [Tanacetum coccineum]
MQQTMPNPEDIIDPTTSMNMALVLMAKAFKLNYSTPTNNNQRISSNPHNRQIAQSSMNLGQDSQMQMVGGNNGLIVVLGIANQNPNRNSNVVAVQAEGNENGSNGNQIRCYNCRGLGHLARNCTIRLRRRDVAYLQTQLLIAQKEEAGIQLQAKEFDLMAAATDLDEIEEVNANCILMANLQQVSTSGTQTDKAPVYDSDGSTEIHDYDNCYNNELFNMFTQEEQYTKLLEPIPKPHQVQQNDSNVIYKVSSVEQDGGTIKQHPATVEETHDYFKSLNNNLAFEVEKVNTVNHRMRETNPDLTIELARYKNQEKCFEISQEKYDKLERCYQKSVYQEQCLTKMINALHLSFDKQITTLNEEIANLNNQLSKEKSSISYLQEEKKKLKSDFKIREDELLDKQIQLENKIKELNNILVKMGQSIQTTHMLSPKPESFYHTEQKMALGYQNPLSQASSLEITEFLNGKVLLERHDPPAVYDSEETLQLAQENEIFPIVNEVDARLQNFKIQFLKEAAKFVRDFKSLVKEADESLAKHKALELEIERLLRAVVSQDIMSVVQNPTVVETSDLQTELERFLTKGTSANTKFANQSTSGTKLYPMTPFPKSKIIPKVVETNDLSKPVTSNSVPTPIESKVMTNDNVIAPGMFRIDPRVDNTAKTRRLQPRSNTKNDRVPSASKSSCIKNKEVEVEEHHRNLLLSKNKKHMSSECNNVKLAIRSDTSKVICAMCKQCLITANHDVCVLKYMNGMNSHGTKQKPNVSNIANQMKLKQKVKKPKNVGSKERLASPKPRKPRTFLRWSPTGRIFDLKGKIIASSESECQSDGSNGDNACTSNPQEPKLKWFPNSTSFLGRLSKFVYGASTRVFPSI